MSSRLLNCKTFFEIAYNQRYTWPGNFKGYKGSCLYSNNQASYQGEFSVNEKFNVDVCNIKNDEIAKLITAQLFEVTIHRVKRDFERVHSENNFDPISDNERGLEMIVSGKNQGDKYRIKDNKINMVFRNIHGIIVEIFVEEFLDTGKGFLSKKYTSQQLEKESKVPISPKYNYLDEFINIYDDLWILNKRLIMHLDDQSNPIIQTYNFNNLTTLN